MFKKTMEPKPNPELDRLIGRVDLQIIAANRMKPGDDKRPKAYTELAITEARIADLVPSTDSVGATARKGAIHATLESGDPDGARELFERYKSEPDIAPDLVEELRRFLPE